jgi:hypothetical protein
MPEIHNSLPGGGWKNADKKTTFPQVFPQLWKTKRYSSTAKIHTDPAARGKPKCQDFAWSRDLVFNNGRGKVAHEVWHIQQKK